MGLILSLIVAACASGQSTPATPAASTSPAGDPVADVRAAELSLRQEIRTRAGLVNVGPGALELAALMDRRESVALNAFKAGEPVRTSRAPYALLVDAPTPGQSITGPVTILSDSFVTYMTMGPGNTRTLDDNPMPGAFVKDPSYSKTETQHGCGPMSQCEGPVVENVTVAGNPGQIFTQTTLTVGYDGSSISVDIKIDTYGEVHDATTNAVVYRIESTGTGHMDGDACPDASGITRLHMEFSAKENYFIAADPAGGSGGYGLEQSYSGDARIKADDSANLAGMDMDIKAHVESKGGGRAAGATQSELRVFSNDATGSQTFGYDAAVGFTAGADSRQPTSTEGLFFITHGMDAYLTNPAKAAAKATETAWRSGMCIRVSASPNGGDVEKDSVTSVKVTVKQRYEGTELDKPVEATFGGVKSLDPTGQKQPAPATFSYTAGSNEGDKGGAAFKSVSNRGIGHTSVQFAVVEDAKGLSGTITLVDDWRDGASWSKQTLTIHVRLKPQAGYDGVTGWFDDDGSTYEYQSSGLYHTADSFDPTCVTDNDWTSNGSGSFGTDSTIDLTVDSQPPGEASLGVAIKAPSTSKFTMTCLGQTQTITGTSDGGWAPYCGNSSFLTGAPAAANGSHDFACSAPRPNGTGSLTVSGSLTRR